MTSYDLPSSPRLLLQAELTPVQGTRFQPTGFPDVGPGTYTMPDGKEYLVVESAQSVANRLEAACWDDAAGDLVVSLKGLSYVRVNAADGSLLTASIHEAHRLNSAYIERSPLGDVLEEECGSDATAGRRRLVPLLAKYDVGCLLHGCFFPKFKDAGSPKLARALSGFIEAEGIGRVMTGGVKNDRVQSTKDEDEGKTAAEGFGNVPFHRTEFVAERITAFFNLDLEQIRGYRLGREMERLLLGLALFKIRRFLATGLRLRTACDLHMTSLDAKAPAGFELPSLNELSEVMPELIQAASSHFASPPVTTTVFPGAAKKAAGEKKPKKAKAS